MNTYLYFTGGLERNSRNLYFVDPLWHLRKMLNDVADSVLRRERQRRELFGFIYKRQNLFSRAPVLILVAPAACRGPSALPSPHRRISCTSSPPSNAASSTMSSRIHPHSPLPAPAMRASTPSVQSKSHVLAGVQDAYWSDDEAVSFDYVVCW